MSQAQQFFIEQARQRKARALTAVILDRCADHARVDMEGLISKLMNCTADQWANMAAMASTNPPSMATCQIVFINLRGRDVGDRQPARRTLEEMKTITDELFY